MLDKEYQKFILFHDTGEYEQGEENEAETNVQERQPEDLQESKRDS